MRIGFAPAGILSVVRPILVAGLVILALWLYGELPDTPWRWAFFLAIYLVSALIYLNLGVWLHEQLHCLGFAGTPHARHAHITYERKHVLVLGGYYRVQGGMRYPIVSRALLGPLWLSGGLVVLACLGLFLLPGWSVPLLLSLAIVSLLDMSHDLYMYLQIMGIGERGKYWDRGKVIEAVWKA
jgi:hypothetical protein